MRIDHDWLAMIFWIAVAALAAVVTYVVTSPLTKDAAAGQDAGAADLAVYKDQLVEIDADYARGTISDVEAEAARAEVGRRVLRRVDRCDGSPEASAPGSAWIKRIYLITTLTLPLVSVGLYVWLGAPGMPGVPLEDRLARSSATATPDDLVAKVEARLREHPEDGKGWDVIAPIYLAQNKFDQAAAAYADAMKILGETPTRLMGFANARIRAENGMVPDDARKALQTATAADPKAREPRMWLALAKEQDGKILDAAADYRALIAEAPADAPWRAALQDRLARLEASTTAGATANKPTVPGSGNVEDMSDAERQALIDKMVGGLADRLRSNPKDKEGWLKLIRSYQMLGRKDAAVKAFADAKAGLAGDDTAVAEVDAFARQLGINQ
jgi:cytochrome c-type biogenesis protein CcmH